MSPVEPTRFRRSGVLFIVSAPSGAGKTTISRKALATVSGLTMSISSTTRAPRSGEVPGRDYDFLSEAEFARRCDADEFAEWAKVHDFLYGTPRAPIDQRIAAGEDTLLDVDVQGARQLKDRYSASVAIFLMPPSAEELERRLRGRATDSEEAIQRRLLRARAEMEEVVHYDYCIVNHDLAESVALLRAIVEAERARVARLLLV